MELLVRGSRGGDAVGLVLRSLSSRGTAVVDLGEFLFIGALLGPEATRRGVYRSGNVLFLGVVFENCRVDASIFVVKLLRAHGGCLGIRSR